MKRKISWIIGVLILTIGILWINRVNIILHVPGFIIRLTQPIGPNKEIVWDKGPSTVPDKTSPRKPNIIVILADDLGFNDISYYANDKSQATLNTPHIDTLAQQGVAFTNAYSGSAVCAPSRASIMTGRYPTRFGYEFMALPNGMGKMINLIAREQKDRILYPVVSQENMDNMMDFDDMGMPAEEITIAESLKQAGYHTVHIGKWHLGRKAPFRPEAQGFDESLLMDNFLYLPEDHPDVVNAKLDFDPVDRFLWANGRFSASFNGGDRFEPGGYLTDYYTDEAVKVIEANKNRPFFMYLAHWGVHSPLQAAKSDYDALSHIKDEKLRVYTAMIRALDRSVGRITESLKQNGLEDNTLIIFTSDNGGPGYIGIPTINQPYRGWKLTMFEGGTHVPFFVKWPKKVAAGNTFAAPISHMDIFATAVGIAGAKTPEDRVIDGKNLIPFVDGEKPGNPHDILFWRQGHYQAVLANGWKLQVTKYPNKVWLFNLNEDPTEKKNLADERPEKVAELKALLKAHNDEQAKPLWPSVFRAPIYIDKTLDQPEAPGDEYIFWAN
ncbi:sulfatase [bacterium]|nr:sulfatase [bacterium]